MTRTEILELVIQLGRPIDQLRSLVSTLEWDIEQPLVVLKRQHFVAVLEKYLWKKVSASEVRQWAELIECREDIDFESGAENLIKEMIFELATPELSSVLSPSRAQHLIEKLTAGASLSESQ